MVEEENLKNLVLVESDLKDGESDLDERYTPPLPYEGIGDNVKDAGEDGIATPKQWFFGGKSPIKSITSQVQVLNEIPP